MAQRGYRNGSCYSATGTGVTGVFASVWRLFRFTRAPYRHLHDFLLIHLGIVAVVPG